LKTLLIIDIQNDYFRGGAYPLVEPDAAALQASRLLARFREASEPVVHMQHVWDAPEAEFMRPGTDGVEIHESVRPLAGETVLTKAMPNSFLGTDLEAELRSHDTEGLVVAGMMTSMCVDATVRAAADLGFTITLAHDACAAPDLAHGGVEVPGAMVHAAFVAALGDGYATVAGVGELV